MQGLSKNDTFFLKGIAICLIIISHIGGAYSIRYFTPLGGIGVAIFLFLSGYGLSESVEKKGVVDFWRKRIVTIYIPYIFIELFVLFFLEDFSIKKFFLNIMLISPRRTEIWYLQYLLFCYLCFWLIHNLISKENQITILLIISVISFLVLPEIASEQAFSFWCGCVFSRRKELLGVLHKFSFLFLVIGCVALILKQTEFIRNAPQIIMNFIQLNIKLPIALFGIGIICCSLKKYLNKIFINMGKISYELYIVHINFLFFLKNNCYMGLFVFLVATIFCSIITYYIQKKMVEFILCFRVNSHPKN